jgi:hypothetical protein
MRGEEPVRHDQVRRADAIAVLVDSDDRKPIVTWQQGGDGVPRHSWRVKQIILAAGRGERFCARTLAFIVGVPG